MPSLSGPGIFSCLKSGYIRRTTPGCGDAVHVHLEVAVVAGGIAGGAHMSDHLALLTACP